MGSSIHANRGRRRRHDVFALGGPGLFPRQKASDRTELTLCCRQPRPPVPINSLEGFERSFRQKECQDCRGHTSADFNFSND